MLAAPGGGQTGVSLAGRPAASRHRPSDANPGFRPRLVPASPRVRRSRRIWVTPRPQDAPADWLSNHVVGEHAVDPGSIAHIVKRRSAAAGYDPDLLGGHSLKRDAKNTAKVAAPIPPSLHSLAARQLRHPRRLSRAG